MRVEVDGDWNRGRIMNCDGRKKQQNKSPQFSCILQNCHKYYYVKLGLLVRSVNFLKLILCHWHAGSMSLPSSGVCERRELLWDLVCPAWLSHPLGREGAVVSISISGQALQRKYSWVLYSPVLVERIALFCRLLVWEVSWRIKLKGVIVALVLPELRKASQRLACSILVSLRNKLLSLFKGKSY